MTRTFLYTLALCWLSMCSAPVFAEDATTETTETTEEAAPAEEAAPIDATEEAAPAEEAAPIDATEEAAPATEDGEDAEATVPDAPSTDAEAVQTATALLDAIKGKQWPLAVGLFLTLLVYIVNRFALDEKLGEKVVPWLAFGVGVAGATATGLIGGEAILESIVAGAIAGVAGVGGWEVLMKKVTDKADKAE